ncbi:MAG: K+/H+ antiporter subunit F [Idiomarina sp.]|jgi:multicomponent K+:H+ antiporter subunit F|uniref:Multisubunit potassium/proton antiporter PhaF subunit n=1 Tax=Idiomarina aquatica TaxID=1327752 RepID=A0A4V3CNF3_9GAMM|nr:MULTISPECIES: K+/H+ antiporter subunit F [Idiomarina]MAK71636.1 K+/H+ antiporter subunit F [Idiomarinaceae bacterium]MBT40989.1 K+/H+ antiporter subunit F [Idiomarina sp.]TDP33202.1 multisubunit potassium/proton antiporter PhaF subunit [Idiomarina aquatica]HAD48874.1 K+/H+ antiporter subunit F [Idiomarina sp.]|tara:strand:- start:123 stop:392 length:270 start_codon:yes stop_codon:yes gene_type:complete
MLGTILQIAFLLFSLSILMNLWRLVKGPDLPDRILALDTIYINSLALLLLLGMFQNTQTYFEAALLIAMFGFVGTIAAGKFLLRGDLIE